MPADGRKHTRDHRVEAVACVILGASIALGGAGAVLAASRQTTAAPPSEALYRKLCRTIRGEHVRALFRTSVAPIQLGGSSDCAFLPRGGTTFGAGIRVFLRIDDGDKTLWAHRGDHPYGKFRSLSIPGAQAKWGYQGGRWPSIVDAREGTFTCTLIPAAGGPGLVGFPGTPLAAARSFAERSARVCEDVFAAHR